MKKKSRDWKWTQNKDGWGSASAGGGRKGDHSLNLHSHAHPCQLYWSNQLLRSQTLVMSPHWPYRHPTVWSVWTIALHFPHAQTPKDTHGQGKHVHCVLAQRRESTASLDSSLHKSALPSELWARTRACWYFHEKAFRLCKHLFLGRSATEELHLTLPSTASLHGL